MSAKTIGPALVAVGDGTAHPGCLRVEDGRIAAIEDGPQHLDYELPFGSVVTPGLIDLHTNGTGRLWFNREPQGALSAMAAVAPTCGTTAFLPTIMSDDWERMLHAATAVFKSLRMPVTGARPLGVHLEGPFLNPDYRRVHAKECLLLPTPARVEQLLEMWPGGPFRITMAPEIDGAPRAAAELYNRGIVLSAGHTGATYATGMSAIEQGYRILTHAFNAMPPIHHRSSSVLVSYLLDPTSFCEVIADGVHVSPEHVALLYRLKGINLVLTTDAMPLIEGLVEDGGAVRTKDGIIAGSLLTMDQAVRNLMSATGIALPAAVACATWAPARALGVDDEIGMLCEGMRADFVVWDRRHKISHTFVGGELVYSND